MEDLPRGYGDEATVYTVRSYTLDGAARDDVALVVYDLEGQVMARQWFDTRELDDAPLAGPGVSDWLRDVTFMALNSEGRDTCADCGNGYVGLFWRRSHAPDCAYYDGEHTRP
jgi:hypothetical protein